MWLRSLSRRLLSLLAVPPGRLRFQRLLHASVFWQKYPRAHGPDRARNGPVALQGRGPSRRWLPGWLCEVSHVPPNNGNDSIVATSGAPCTSVADEVIESRLTMRCGKTLSERKKGHAARLA